MTSRKGVRPLTGKTGTVLLLGCAALALALAAGRLRSRPAPAPQAPGLATAARAAGATFRLEAESAAANPGAPIDLSATMRRAHYAFHPQGREFVAGNSTGTATLDARGTLSLTPVRGCESAPVQGAPLRIETLSIGRGSSPASPARASITPEGGLRVERGKAVEEVTSSEQGFEQSWSFARRPAGRGDLLVRLRASGQRFEGEAPGGGLRFVDPVSGIGFNYGDATWTDARGERTPIKPRFADGALILRVPAALVDSSAYPAVLDPFISKWSAPSFSSDYGDGDLAEFPNWPAGAQSGLTDQHSPKVVWNPAGGNYVAVWTDYRCLKSYDIFGVRIATDGTVLDPNGFAITAAPLNQSHPAIACGPTNCLVAYENAPSTSYFWRPTSGPIVGNLLTAGAGGAVSVGPPISISTDNQATPAVAYNPDTQNYLVAWNQGWQIWGKRVSSAGAVLESDPFGISTSVFAGYAHEDAAPAVAWSPRLGAFLAVWETWAPFSSYFPHPDWEIYGTRISEAGGMATVVDPGGIPIGTHQDCNFDGNECGWGGGNSNFDWGASVACGPNNCLVAWMGGWYTGIWGSLVGDIGSFATWDCPGMFCAEGPSVSPQFKILDPATIEFRTTILPAVAYNSGTGNYYVAWQDERTWPTTIYGTRVKDDPAACTQPIDTGTDGEIAPGSTPPACVLDGTTLTIPDWWWITTTRFQAGIPIGAPAPDQQFTPTVASDGTNQLVAWTDTRKGGYFGGPRDIYMVQVNGDGTLPLDIFSNPVTAVQLSPADSQTFSCCGAVCTMPATGDLYCQSVSGAMTVHVPEGSLAPGETVTIDCGSRQGANLSLDPYLDVTAALEFHLRSSAPVGALDCDGAVNASGVPLNPGGTSGLGSCHHAQAEPVGWTEARNVVSGTTSSTNADGICTDSAAVPTVIFYDSDHDCDITTGTFTPIVGTPVSTVPRALTNWGYVDGNRNGQYDPGETLYTRTQRNLDGICTNSATTPTYIFFDSDHDCDPATGTYTKILNTPAKTTPKPLPGWTYYDTNGNGVYDPGEPLFTGVLVVPYGQNAETLRLCTDSLRKPSYIFAKANDCNPTTGVGSIAILRGILPTDPTGVIAVPAQSGWAYFDSNKNGVYDLGEELYQLPEMRMRWSSWCPASANQAYDYVVLDGCEAEAAAHSSGATSNACNGTYTPSNACSVKESQVVIARNGFFLQAPRLGMTTNFITLGAQCSLNSLAYLYTSSATLVPGVVNDEYGEGCVPGLFSAAMTVPVLGTGSAFAAANSLADDARANSFWYRSAFSRHQAVVQRHPPPVVTVPTDISLQACGPSGIPVSFRASAIDGVEGALAPSCVPASGSTFPLGTTTVTCTATNSTAISASASFKVSVGYAFAGVLPPLNADGSSVVKLGRSVPVKFQLTCPSGLVSSARARLFVDKLFDGVVGFEEVAESTSAADTGNYFRWAGDQYLFNLDTSPLGSGTWQLRIDLGDGIPHRVGFSVKP